ncbi:H-NS histone family protein [Piscinibacter sp. XHJ-5]|uniref:H-NS histone family protein n=1 Tax=Piscinibacter sp. XHJ-5 TaxID=3037797 RepID=UPI0024535AA5|nr:H-NS histone family protein [Piscinibacter sp. XHJ-5]
MKTYMAIKAEIAKLEKQAQAARKAEVAEVVRKIKEAIAAYGLTANDLGLGRGAASKARTPGAAKPRSRPSIGMAKYRDPATGKTWTGQGRPPAWITDAKDRDAFLIEGATRGGGSNGLAKTTRKPRAAVKRKGRPGRKSTAAATKTGAVQIESSAASE